MRRISLMFLATIAAFVGTYFLYFGNQYVFLGAGIDALCFLLLVMCAAI